MEFNFDLLAVIMLYTFIFIHSGIKYLYYKKYKNKIIIDFIKLRSVNIIYLALTFLAIYSFFDDIGVGAKNQTVLNYIYFGFLTISLYFVLDARRTLGIQHSPYPEIIANHKYINKSYYKYLSHPIYTFEIFAVFFGTLIVSNFIAYFGFTLWIISIVIKIKAEETLLRRHFAQEYETQIFKFNKLLLHFGVKKYESN